MLFIATKYPKKFNDYLVCKIKKELKGLSLFFNPLFLYRGKKYSLVECLSSLSYNKGRIFFKLEYPIRYLIYNNRQLYWLDTIDKYRRNIAIEYFYWMSGER